MATFKNVEQAGWTSRAERYDDYFSVVTRQAIEPVLGQAGPLAGQRLLDVCCGTGDLAAVAAQLGATVTGTDFAQSMIDVARTKHPALSFQVGDAEALPFADASFDVLTCAFGLYHLAEPEKAFEEAARVLKAGGRYITTTWLPPEQGWDMFDLLVAAVKSHGSSAVQLPPAPPPFQFASEETARDALAANGFEAIQFHKAVASWNGVTGDNVLELIDRGTVRAAMLIETQPPDAREAIRAAIRLGAERYRVDGMITMRWPYLIMSGTIGA